MGLFDYLESEGNRSKSEEEIRSALEIKALRFEDFLNALAAMGHIKRDEHGYSNTQETSTFMVSTSPNNISSIFVWRANSESPFKNMTLYLKGQEFKKNLTNFDVIYSAIPHFNFMFASYMEATCKFVSRLLPLVAEDVWKSISSFADIGGGSGYMTIEVCRKFAHLRGVNTDLKHLDEVF